MMWIIRRAGTALGHTPGYLALRWFALFASLVAVVGVYIYARRLLGRSCAMLSASLMALGSEVVIYGGMARGYALLTALSIWYAILLEDTLVAPTGVRLASLVTIVALGAYVHYFFVLTVVASFAYVWLAPIPRARKLAVTSAAMIGLASLVPWFVSFMHGQHARVGGAAYHAGFSGHRVVDAPWNLFTGYLHVGRFVHDTQLIAFSLVCVGALILVRRNRGRLVALAGVLPLVSAAVGTAAGLPLSDTRNLLGAAPFLAILASAPLVLAPRRTRIGGALVGILAITTAFVGTQLPLARTSYVEVAGVLASADWNRHPPVVFFGQSGSTMKLVFSSLPQGFWMAPGVPPAKACATVYAVVQDAAGQRWLHAERSHVVRIDQVPFYGVGPEGSEKRFPVDVVQFARLPHDALVLARESGGKVFLRTPVPQVTKDAPPPAPYPACLS